MGPSLASCQSDLDTVVRRLLGTRQRGSRSAMTLHRPLPCTATPAHRHSMSRSTLPAAPCAWAVPAGSMTAAAPSTAGAGWGRPRCRAQTDAAGRTTGLPAGTAPPFCPATRTDMWRVTEREGAATCCTAGSTWGCTHCQGQTGIAAQGMVHSAGHAVSCSSMQVGATCVTVMVCLCSWAVRSHRRKGADSFVAGPGLMLQDYNQAQPVPRSLLGQSVWRARRMCPGMWKEMWWSWA
mmetsp:Transcript_10314/g.22181  ORF Transcript_10314/g.22181 Transcript_10314/m.22181 type:complete len:237 (-) Transcript_10314:238-948(-)